MFLSNSVAAAGNRFDLGDPEFSCSGISVVDLAETGCPSMEPGQLRVTAADIVALKGFPANELIVLGKPGDTVQLADHDSPDSANGVWMFSRDTGVAPGLDLYTHQFDGLQVALYVQEGLVVLDADGNVV